jgi:hypothetical protein
MLDNHVAVSLGLSLLMMLAVPAQAGGLIGDIIKGAGRVVGVKPIEDLGRNLDAEHKRFKDANPLYKKVEEEGSATVRNTFSLACTATYETVISSVRGKCSGFTSQSLGAGDRAAIDRSLGILYRHGITSPAELSGVSISWCAGDFWGLGIAPSPNEIILNRSLLGVSDEDRALTLAHEVHHIRQYRTMGAGPFKCNYSQQYIACGGCQDQRHAMEREAYQFEAAVAQRLNQTDAQAVSKPGSVRMAAFLQSRDVFAPKPMAAPVAHVPSESAPRRFARNTCTLHGELAVEAVAACVDDLEVVFDDLHRYMRQDSKRLTLERSGYYHEIGGPDFETTCKIVGMTMRSEAAQKTRTSRCVLHSKRAVRELHEQIKG